MLVPLDEEDVHDAHDDVAGDGTQTNRPPEVSESTTSERFNGLALFA